MQLSLAERDEKVIWHPYTSQKKGHTTTGIIRGEGVWLIDEDEHRYIDAISSWWVTLHGHAHPYIAHKLYEQALLLEQVIFAGFTHLPAVQLGEKLLPLLPGKFSKIFYSDNGSTATEVAIKMSLQYWWNKGNTNRTRVLALTDGYHGDTFGAMSASGRSIFTNPFRDKLFEVTYIDIESPDHEKLFEEFPADEYACFIYEPLVQGAAGMKMYSPGKLDALLATIKAHDIICIADEVMTGFGRTGTTFASAQCNEKPDIICLSKGLTGGTLPLGITACNEKIYAAYVSEERLHTFFHGHSFTANPLSCATALASLELLLETACQQNIQRITQLHAGFIKSLGEEKINAKIKNVRQTGTILAFEILSEKDGYLNTIGEFVTRRAMAKSVFLRPLGNTLYILPPYCITMDELGLVYAVIREILEEL
ncbi:MAG TPA: adenosylmethionine--8-amino-7-oxononanoate transaminase [Flavitalea sp.]|nr:adenosylmethionine--8-amino-7-oxononanoate transaminase [Flavitalea sp.]